MASNFRVDLESLPLNRSAGFPQRVLGSIRDLLIVLAADGRVLYASQMCQTLTSHSPEFLVGKHITTFMHYDDIPVFLVDFKEGMSTGNSWRCHHRVRRRDDTFAPFESTFKPYTDSTVDDDTGVKDTKMCLMTTRPYPISCTSLMDSFLEHCTTNIRLTTQLKQLQDEAQEAFQSTMTASACVQTADNTIQCTTLTVEATTHPVNALQSTAPASVHSITGSVTSHKRTYSDSSSATKMLADSVVGDMGIEITTSRLQTVKDTGNWTTKPRTKKRKEEHSKDYLCKECGTNDSPEWRRGPLGPKTLCNACGLRWSKGHRGSSPSK